MNTPDRHLAQINVARMVAPLDDPRMAEFVAQLAEINALADRSAGFVWRLQGQGGDATSIKLADPTLLLNMSVWKSRESLHAYTYRSAHAGVMRDRKKWFHRMDGPYYALWWIPVGHLPSVAEGEERLAYLAKHGASEHAFWFGTRFAPGPDGGTYPTRSNR
jgi:hypothetical protein